jgi:hypothetical protein
MNVSTLGTIAPVIVVAITKDDCCCYHQGWLHDPRCAGEQTVWCTMNTRVSHDGICATCSDVKALSLLDFPEVALVTL